MTNLERRLRKLQAVLTDHTGLVPNTKPWLEYWLAKYEGLALVQEDLSPGSIPLTAFRAIADRYEGSL